MKKVFLSLIVFLYAGILYADRGNGPVNFERFKSINSAVAEAVYRSSITSEINGQTSAPIGNITNSTITSCATYLYAVVVSSPGSQDAVFNVYDTSGNWAVGTRSITGWVQAGLVSPMLQLPPLNIQTEYGLGYTSSGTVPAKLMFLYREK